VLDRPEEPEPVAELTPTSGNKRRRLLATVLLVVAGVFSGLCLIVVYSAWWDGHSIDDHLGRANADVLSVSFNRTVVRFVTPDGAVVIPPNGVMYPDGLAAGEQIRVEYDTQNPDVVRVAERGWTLAFLPVGSTLAGAWVLIGPTAWWLRRTSRPASPAAAKKAAAKKA
jgi:hypothetical protein